SRRLTLVFLEVKVKMSESMVLDVPADVPQVLELRQARAGRSPVRDEACRQTGQCSLKLRVMQRNPDILLEGLCRRLHPAFLMPQSYSPALAGRSALCEFRACEQKVHEPLLRAGNRRIAQLSGQHLRDVANGDLSALALQLSGHVHEA